MSCSLTIFTLFHAGPSRVGADLRFWSAFVASNALGCCAPSPVVRGAGAGAGAITGGAWYAGGMCVVYVEVLSVDCSPHSMNGVYYPLVITPTRSLRNVCVSVRRFSTPANCYLHP